jgi:fermentation-respiration switch protein FrsA (DUF1100 family)
MDATTTLLLIIFASLLVLVTAYLLLSPRLSERLYHRELFNPLAYPAGNYNDNALEGIKAKDVFFQAEDGTKLHGWYFERAGASRTILLFHGNTGNLGDLQTLLCLLLRTGCSVFAFDYRGFGRSEGKPSVATICQDGLAAYDYLINQEDVPLQDVVLYGESLGASVAVQVSRARPCAAIITQSAFSSLRRAAREAVFLLGLYPQFLFPPPYLNTLAVLKEEHSPLLILHGEKDPEISITHAEELYKYASEPKTLVRLPNTAHSDIADADAELFVKTIKKFLSSL